MGLNKKGGIICEDDACPEGLNKVSVRNGKNRFSRDAAGMRDYLINVFMSTKDDPAGHIAELQIHHMNQVNAKHTFHCVYSYVRSINEAINQMKTDPKKVFCDKEECKKFWIDTKKKSKPKDEKEAKDDEPELSPLMKMAEKWLGKEGTDKTKKMWDDIIKDHLKDLTEDQKKVLDNAKAEDKKAKDFGFLEIKGRKPDNTDPTKMVEVLLFTKLSDAMVAAYDRATLYLPDEGQQPMYEYETEYKGVKGKDGAQLPLPQLYHCEEDKKKICKCSQAAKLQFEVVDKDIPCSHSKSEQKPEHAPPVKSEPKSEDAPPLPSPGQKH